MAKVKDARSVKIPIKQRLSTFSDKLEYKIMEEHDLNLTITRAYEFLEKLEEFKGERSIRQNHVQFLYDEFVSGRFLWHNVMLASARVTGEDPNRFYRINGQHTCWMRVSIPANMEPVKAECTERVYEVPSQEQLRNLYACFDRGAPRSSGHISRVLLMETEAAANIPASYIGKLVAGFRLFFSEDWKTANVNPNDLTGLIEKSYASLFNTVGLFLKIHYDDGKEFSRAGCIAAMFSTFEKNVMASDAFWTGVCTGTALESKSDARWRLRNYIQTHGHNIHNPGSGIISAEDLYRTCVGAWNRWRAGEEVDKLGTADKRPKARQ